MGGEEDRDDFYGSDGHLRRLLRMGDPDLLRRNGERLDAFGRWVGGEVDAAAVFTERSGLPRLEPAGEGGDPAAGLILNPRAVAVHRDAYRHGIVGLNYQETPEPFLLTFVMGYLLSQADIAVHCPVTLTGAVALVLHRFAPAPLRDAYMAGLARMDGEALTGATWVTERDGGSDVGAATTTADPTAGGHLLNGLKWFCSNAGSDLALATARPLGAPPGSAGLGLYLVPRRLADGTPNAYRLRRLKDKLGTRGLATGEIELNGAFALEVAPPPLGFRVMMEALEFSRVHNAFAAAGVLRRAFREAVRHAGTRRAFGASIIAFPMLRDMLLDLQTDWQAALVLSVAAARAFDAVWAAGRQPDPAARTWLRMLVALAKYRTAAMAVRGASAAIEVFGGIGYTEEYVTARLLRDAQVLPVWEGTANIQALELLRLVAGPLDGFAVFRARIAALAGAAPPPLADSAGAVTAGLEDAAEAVATIRKEPEAGLSGARRLLDFLADLGQGALLLEAAGWSLGREQDAGPAWILRRWLAQHRLRQDARALLRSAIPETVVARIIALAPVEPRTL